MKIKEGDKLPNAKVFIINMNKEYEHKEISTDEILSKDKIILFGLPGAFTPIWSIQHLPRLEDNYDKFLEKGFDDVYCISVNDSFVMNAWAKNQNID